MSLDSLLPHIAVITRASSMLDPLGNERPVWEDAGSTVARLTEKRERVWVSERSESVIVTAYLLLVPADTDILERDQVVVDSVTFMVSAVIKRVGASAVQHKSVSLDLVS